METVLDWRIGLSVQAAKAMKRAVSSGRPRLIVLLGVVALLAPAIMLPCTESRTYYRPAGASSYDFFRADPAVPYYVETQTRYYSVFYFPMNWWTSISLGLSKSLLITVSTMWRLYSNGFL